MTSTQQFKAGDMVVALNGGPSSAIREGYLYRVLGYSTHNLVVVTGKSLKEYHERDGFKENRTMAEFGEEYGWYTQENRFKLLDTECLKCIHACKMREKCALFEGDE